MLCNVQLILFFDIYNIVKLTKRCQIDVDAQTAQTDEHIAGASTTEREIQTELHPVPFHKDESYVWNLWDLRRKAIELVNLESTWNKLSMLKLILDFQANLRRKKTTSAQTSFSYHKLDIANQRHEKRQKGLQTDSSKEMNTE